MTVLIAVVVMSIAVEIVLYLTGYGALARAIEPYTFGLFSVVFLLFGIYYRRRGKTLRSTGSYVTAAIWAIYTILLIIGVG